MKTNNLLYSAIVLSLGVHLAVLLPLASDYDTIVIESPTRPSSRMSIVVSAASEQPQSKTTPPQPAAQPARKPVVKATSEQQAPKPTTTVETKTEQEDQEVAETARTPANSTDPQARIDHDMLEYLHAEFRLRFQYPLLARKRGWSGEVVIALNVNHDGMINNIAVQKSSGYPLLDDNAVDTFRAIGLVSPAIQSHIIKTRHLSIPVIYKLTGG